MARGDLATQPMIHPVAFGIILVTFSKPIKFVIILYLSIDYNRRVLGEW
jgi:hypothetical protein